MKLTPSGVILLGALALCMVGKGQDSIHVPPPDNGEYRSQGWPKKVDSTNLIMMKIVLRDKISIHFFRQGYKRGEKYWYIDGKRVRPLPRNWYVWEYKIIKP